MFVISITFFSLIKVVVGFNGTLRLLCPFIPGVVMSVGDDLHECDHLSAAHRVPHAALHQPQLTASDTQLIIYIDKLCIRK